MACKKSIYNLILLSPDVNTIKMTILMSDNWCHHVSTHINQTIS